MNKFVAIYGGSYNLPTLTHRAIGIAVRDQVNPDEVWYMVSAQNPHKSSEDMAAFCHRVEMTKLDILNEARLVVSDVEKEISEKIGSTQSADILRDLLLRNPETRFAWVMGADCFANLHTWGNYDFILSHVPIIVIPRKNWTERARDSVAAHCGLSHQIFDPRDLRSETGWYILDFPEDGVNATNARNLIKQGILPDSIRPNVYYYALDHGLFL